jgi:hypothetical protein
LSNGGYFISVPENEKAAWLGLPFLKLFWFFHYYDAKPNIFPTERRRVHIFNLMLTRALASADVFCYILA